MVRKKDLPVMELNEWYTAVCRIVQGDGNGNL
jgi:hypothetical protein